MTPYIHPELHLALHRQREKEIERSCELMRATRVSHGSKSWAARLRAAVAAGVSAGRHAFADATAVEAPVVEEGAIR